MRRFIVMLTIPFLAGCIFQSPRDLVTPAAKGELSYNGLQLEGFGTYRARFTMSFEGDSDWWYQVNISSDGDLKEFELSIEGVPESKDPGDVRVIEAKGVYTLQGEATEGDCWRFPAGADRQPEPLTPDAIIRPDAIRTELKDAGTDRVLGRSADRLKSDGGLEPEFSRSEISIWIDRATGSVLRYQFQLEGPDPLFDGGEGRLTGDFEVVDLRRVKIDPIEGCESEFPLPDDASELYLLPDFVGYRTQLSPEEMVDFLVGSIEKIGWQLASDTDAIPGTATLSFYRGKTALEIFVQSEGTWTRVEFYLAPLSSP